MQNEKLMQGLVKKQTWTEAELAQVGELLEICNAYENLSLKLDPAMLRSHPGNETNDFAWYEDGKLVGLLALDDMGSKAREMTGMVHPDFRHRGIFTALLTTVIEEAKHRGIERLVLICERFSRSGQAFVAAIGAQYDFSEHKMVLKTFNERSSYQERLHLQKAGCEDVDAIARIISTSFGQSEEGAKRHIVESMHSPYRQYYYAKLGSELICSLNLFAGDTAFAIYGFGILPQYRRRGFGRQMLEQLIKNIRSESQKRIALEVETENTNAISLYRSCGFKEITTYGYYNIDIE